jgi:thiol-disulfide isomerase/thioredoxin
MALLAPVAMVVVMAALLVGCGAEQSSGSPTGSTAGSTVGGAPQPAGTGSSGRVAGADKLVACPATISRPPVANGLPDVSLPCLGQGPDIRLADLRGPLLVNVWAQWCPPCRAEAPYLAELQRKAGGKVRLLGVDYDDPQADRAVDFAMDQSLAYPHLADPDKQLAAPLRIAGPPLTAFVDADGAVAYVHRGPFSSQQELDQLVKDKLGVSL